jgi:hypothetical protein
MRIIQLLNLSAAIVACACSSASAHDEPEPIERLASPLAEPSYVEAASYFTEPEDIDAWYTLAFALKSDFDDVCGDTFCEGDYSNFQSLRFHCSVEQGSGVIGRCVWTFAASQDEIDPATGEVTVAGQIWTCPMPLEPDTSARDFVHALSSSDEQALYARLPGSERSLYDGLLDCL